MFGSVYILVSFKMLFHCTSKTIPYEISMSGDYLKLEGNKGKGNLPGPRDLTKRICPGVGNLTKNFARGADLTGFRKFAPGDGNA